MDQPLPSSFGPSILAMILVLFITVVSFLNSKPNKKLPPGPWRLPIIGNMHQIIGSSPHHQLASLAKTYGPMMHLQLGQVPHLVISTAEAAMYVIKNHHDLEFSGRPRSLAITTLSYNYKELSFVDYGDYWRWLRKTSVTDLLGTKRVQSYRYIREEEVFSMVESIRIASSRGSTVDIKEVLLELSSSITARSFFGKSSKERNAVYAPMVKRISEVLGEFSVADFFPSIGFLSAETGLKSKVLKLFREVDGVLQSITDEHREERGKPGTVRDGEPDNFLDLLLDLQEQGSDQLGFSLTTEHIKAIIFDLFSAGIESSSAAIEWVMSELMANPIVMRKVQSEVRQAFEEDGKVDEARLRQLPYFNAVLKESLRLHPPPLLIPRRARENMTINGYEVSSGTTLLINAWAIGRDPKHWTEPEKFRPERFLDNGMDYKGTHFQYIPFGAGRRICAGIQFAMTTIEGALANFLYHFDWKLPNGMTTENLDMSEGFGIISARKVPLHLEFIPWSSPAETRIS